MRFIQRQGVWHLIDENAPEEACVIATLRNEAEVLALKGFCERYLGGDGHQLGEFEVWHAGQRYRVRSFSGAGGKLVLEVEGEDGTRSRVDTQFSLK
jgi:hypothetical protein